MIRRVFAAALAASLVLPTVAAAQYRPLQDDASWGPSFRITPFIGYLTSVDRIEDWAHVDGSQTARLRTEHSIAGGTAGGISIEVPVNSRFGVTGAAVFAQRDHTVFTLNTGEAFQIDGNNVLLARLGGVMHLREEPSDFVLRRLGASVFAGAAVMHERPRNVLGTADFLDSGTHFGLNIGLAAEMPFAQDRFAVQLGIEDNMMFWSDRQGVRLAEEYFGTSGTTRQVTVTSPMSHAWLLRAGISYRAF
jgi:hypothetical protein